MCFSPTFLKRWDTLILTNTSSQIIRNFQLHSLSKSRCIESNFALYKFRKNGPKRWQEKIKE